MTNTFFDDPVFKDTITTLLRLGKVGTLRGCVFLRAPSGAIAGEFSCVTDVPLDAVDPTTGETFRVLPQQVEAYWKLQCPPAPEPDR